MTFTGTTEADKSPGSVCVHGIVLFVFHTVALLLLLPDFLGAD